MGFTVTYNGNGATGGTVPVDAMDYATGSQVTVLGNIGKLIELAGTFAYWNTAADGRGTVYGGGTKFSITSNITLYAQWYITAGLTGGGVTTHYAFAYDSALQNTAANPSGPEPARTNALIAAAESDYNLMADWFGGIGLPFSLPVSVNIANLGGGAHWGPPITLDPGSEDANYCRYLMVSEVTEMFMLSQNKGWFAPDGSNEQSCGEGLSRFLAQQFLVLTGIGVSEPGYAISPSWLNSSLPTTNPSSSQLGPSLTTLPTGIDNAVTSFAVARAQTIPFASTYIIQIDNEQMLVTGVNIESNILTVVRGYNNTTASVHVAQAQVFQNYGSRADYINLTLEYDHGIDAATGCAMLFIYYLQVQLGFSINAIIAAAPGVSNASSCLRGVYRNLTSDNSDPFPFFKQLLDAAFPPSLAATVPGPNPDNPWPLKVVTEPSDVLAIARASTHMDLFWVHPDGSINSTWWDANVANGAWDPSRVFAATAPAKAIAGPVTVVARTPDHMDLFWVHPDGSINSTWWDANVANGAWDPSRVFAATAPAKAIAGPVTVVARTPDHMDLFWVHPDGSINSTWWDANVANGAWDPTRVFAATAPAKAVAGPVAVVARTPDHMDLFWVHPDGSINSTWWDANVANGTWDPTRVFAATAPAKAVAGPVAVVARTSDNMDLFWVHPDGSINSTWWDANVANGAWDPTRVFAATAPAKAVAGPVAVVARTPDHMDLFWVHPDGSINSTWWDANVANGAWDPSRVFAATTPAKAVGRLINVLARAPTHMDLFWVHPDGSINSTWWDANVANGAWDPSRVFAATPSGAVLAFSI